MQTLKITLLTCTHNGEHNIPKMLEAIADQVAPFQGLYEVLVIDNASTDNTAKVAQETIQQLQLNGRVLREPELGKVNALLTGIQTAQGELVSIIDDDNFIEPGFIQHTIEVFERYPKVGMVGSINQLWINEPLPSWMAAAIGCYGCGQPGLDGIVEQTSEGIVVAQAAYIAGAGSTFRIQPLLDCLAGGYSFFNDAQRGIHMSVSGEDLELCWLMYSLGYQFARDPRIKLRHAINPARINLEYLEKLVKTQGAGLLGFEPFLFTQKHVDGKWPLRWTWQWQLLTKVKRYFRFHWFANDFNTSQEESRFRSWIERTKCIGAIQRILVERSNYNKHIHQVAAGTWTSLRVR
jgi:glycosyltransferase involved in cell wall biosynthesis